VFSLFAGMSLPPWKSTESIVLVLKEVVGQMMNVGHRVERQVEPSDLGIEVGHQALGVTTRE
jgi:hypothetical protein